MALRGPLPSLMASTDGTDGSSITPAILNKATRLPLPIQKPDPS
jgi:hypothetical protein